MVKILSIICILYHIVIDYSLSLSIKEHFLAKKSTKFEHFKEKSLNFFKENLSSTKR